jgi:GNAT superfamily N-acetyltransferase
MIDTRRLNDLPVGIDVLVEASTGEGFTMVQRLRDEWHSGKNKFDLQGEKLFGAFSDDKLVGICGLNIDPFLKQDNIARLRHMYVMPEFRRRGIANKLVNIVLESVDPKFIKITLQSNSKYPGSDRFYEWYGFKRVDIGKTSHELNLPK